MKHFWPCSKLRIAVAREDKMGKDVIIQGRDLEHFCCDFKNWRNILKKIHLHKNINLGDQFLWKTFFSYFNFRTSLFSKIMTNFWRTGAPGIFKIQWFPLSILIFGQKYCFLGPTIFKIPQPNWHCVWPKKLFSV